MFDDGTETLRTLGLTLGSARPEVHEKRRRYAGARDMTWVLPEFDSLDRWTLYWLLL